MPAVVPLAFPTGPLRYRSLQTLLLLLVIGSIASSIWLMPSRLERVAAATERDDQAVITRELGQAAKQPGDPGEIRALVDIALTRGEPEIAADILKQVLAKRPGSITALRLLVEVQRQRHLMREVAALDERLYALAGDPGDLREAADIYASQRMAAERFRALMGLNAAGHATEADIAELAHQSSEKRDGAEALRLVLAWLEAHPGSTPASLVSIAAALSADSPDVLSAASQLGRLIGRSGQDGTLHVLIQTYAERGQPQLSLVAAGELGDEMQARPDVALLLAQLESSQGDYASAQHRLAVLDQAGKLPPGGVQMLAELSIETGDLAHAANLIGTLSAAQLPVSLPRRLVDAAYAAGRLNELARMPIGAIAMVSPGSGAVIALARGERARATELTEAALGQTSDATDLGSAFADAVRTLGMQRMAIMRLTSVARGAALNDEELSFLFDLAATGRETGPALYALLRAQRDLKPRAGVLWATVAAQLGRGAEVSNWLRSSGGKLPSDALLSLLSLANTRSDRTLAHAAADALTGRSDLPDGWTVDEVAFTANATTRLTAARLDTGLALLGDLRRRSASRDRIVEQLASDRDFFRVAERLGGGAAEKVPEWLGEPPAPHERPDHVAARLTLLAGVAPRQALFPLSTTWTTDRARLLPLYAASLLRTGQRAEAIGLLTTSLQGSSVKQQDALLYDVLARTPKAESLPVLRLGANTGRADWVSAYQDGLMHAGFLDELRADLRSRASAAGLDSVQREAIASRLVELGDREGAIAILKAAAAGSAPDQPIVQQLIYLWGPRASPEAVAWVRSQAAAAPMSSLPKWLDDLAYLGSPRAVIGVIAERPAILGMDAQAVRTYGAALLAAHEQAKPDLRGAIASTSAPDRLVALAQLALDTGQASSAWQAASRVVASAGSDPKTLLVAAQAASAAHRSDDASDLYARLLALGPQKLDVVVDAASAMLTAKRAGPGRRLLAAALDRLPKQYNTVQDARVGARALAMAGRRDEATSILEQWMQRSPGNAGLSADLLQLKLDREAAVNGQGGLL